MVGALRKPKPGIDDDRFGLDSRGDRSRASALDLYGRLGDDVIVFR
jgi:hypothetical protein